MKVSIITVVYNNVNFIIDCIDSVFHQTYSDIEYIVIDGGSTDGTQQKIRPFLKNISYFVSEKDMGIYDAYNKGIKMATGNIIGILNSDDFFYRKNTVEKIVEKFEQSGADLVYGKGIFVDQTKTFDVKRIYPSNPFKKNYLLFGWIPLHPTIYVRREIYEKYGFYDQQYKIAGDYEMSLRWFRNEHIKKTYLDEWVVRMRLGGRSTTLDLQKQKSMEDLQIIRKNHLLGLFTLCFKIARKVPHYLIPRLSPTGKFFRVEGDDINS
ncbi:glycosyltransferase family 2 protein [Zunongwangia sp. F260]|uniref:Glycosyltransferase family 2 protein n=1 Tax=Autumnicola lenta TaxID=3075593 RepID=A0ABU3CIN0_9FLAO|nr:glycosyltransferase family 2 protein [Zunongwangia sp. F260]MDT0646078.1 glycosyltransferase family 2 protein [Zunongwangia sp. F260]